RVSMSPERAKSSARHAGPPRRLGTVAPAARTRGGAPRPSGARARRFAAGRYHSYNVGERRHMSANVGTGWLALTKNRPRRPPGRAKEALKHAPRSISRPRHAEDGRGRRGDVSVGRVVGGRPGADRAAAALDQAAGRGGAAQR